MKLAAFCLSALAVSLLATRAPAVVTIETVPVGNSGNGADMRYNLDHRPEGYGSA